MSGTTLADVIIAPKASYDLDFDDSAQSVSVDFRVRGPIVAAMAADFCRLSSAAFQSVSFIEGEIDEKDSIAWGLIKLYYSAFYAGHALIRLFGDACSYFARPHTNRLLNLGVALGKAPSFRIETGFYQCSVSRTATPMTCTRVRGVSGGAHEAFWDIFGCRIRGLATGVLGGPMISIDAQAVFPQLHAFTSLVARQGNFSWLSAGTKRVAVPTSIWCMVPTDSP